MHASTGGAHLRGVMTCVRINVASNRWICAGVGERGTSIVINWAGDRQLDSALTQVGLTTDGSNTFDGGEMNICYL